MSWKGFVSCALIVLLLLPPLPASAQVASPGTTGAPAAPGTIGAVPSGPETGDLKGQAQFYLQTIPTPVTQPGQLTPQAPSPAPPAAPPSAPPAAEAPKEGEKVPAPPILPEKELPLATRAKRLGLDLAPFGYALFRHPPTTFAPVKVLPVGPDYIIGPGDTIRIILWGSVQGEYSLTVDRNGQIAIPKIGVVQVSSLTFKQLQEVLDREFSRQYTNFQMNVTLDNLRTIQIYLVGWARSPGSYSVSSLSTLVSALFDCGGPALDGSMRDIQVRRGKKVVVHFDLYDFLIRGDKSKDIRLMPEDVIYIPLAGPRVGIGGPVKIPAIFELKHERTLTDLIRLAGGLDPIAFKGRVQLFRVQDRKEMVLFEEDLDKVLTGRTRDIILGDGDLARVFPVPAVIAKKVTVGGAVASPGEFGLREGMRIKDLIALAGGPMYFANLEAAELTRVSPTPQGPETTRITINLRQALAGHPRDNILLKNDDFLQVRTIPEWDLYKMVQIRGEVKFPGTYTIKKGERLSSLLARAGGLTERAYPKGAFFTRPAVKEAQAKHLKAAIDRLEADMLARVTEKTEAGDPEEAKQAQFIARQQHRLLAKLREVTPLGRIVIRLDDPERLRGTPADIELTEGDHLAVPAIQQSVNVLGSVVNPTAVLYQPRLTVQDYVNQAGGFAKYADKRGIYVIKASGAAISGRSLGWFGNYYDGQEFIFHVGGVKSLTLEPGDSIVVPEDIEKIAWLKELKDIATIIGQMAITAGVVIAALK